MTNRFLILAVVLAAGCGDNEVAISAHSACHEQAISWCARAQPVPDPIPWAYPDCRVTYEAECAGSHLVDVVDQIACLEDVEINDATHCVPESCRATWANDERSHWCRVAVQH